VPAARTSALAVATAWRFTEGVLFTAEDRRRVAGGEITLAFRRWARARVVAGRVYRTNAGRLLVDSVQEVQIDDIRDADARDAGRADADEARRSLRGEMGDPDFRIAFHHETRPDPRAELAADDRLGFAQMQGVLGRLARLDRASSHGDWTTRTLAVIAEQSGVRAADLARGSGRETAPFKIDVRKLKNLGLTYSLPVGYELSPRGRVVLAALRTAVPRQWP